MGGRRLGVVVVRVVVVVVVVMGKVRAQFGVQLAG